MVKKFISGILKKKGKEEAKESELSAKEPDDVPEELPPLAEDVVEKAEEKESEAKKESKISEEREPPEELPSLDAEEHKGKSEEDQMEELFREDNKGDLPEEIKKAKAAKTRGQIPDKESIKGSIKESLAISSEGGDKFEPEVSFFSSVLEHIKKHEGSKENILAGDLFARMSNYWELKKHEVKSGSSVSTEKKVEENLKNQLEQLKILEQKWQVQKLALDEDLKFLHQREREIQTKVEELKGIYNELNLFKNVKPEAYFHMYDGVVLKSLHDLIDVLEIIDDGTFKHHVTSEKNDFSNWISHVIKDRHLANKIGKAKTKEEMIEVLETEPVVVKNMVEECKKQLSPKKYFWLKNGVVIKSLYQLADALRVMDYELFEKHVTEEKNDFSNWIKNTLKNKELAGKLKKARTKKAMIDILEVFL